MADRGRNPGRSNRRERAPIARATPEQLAELDQLIVKYLRWAFVEANWIFGDDVLSLVLGVSEDAIGAQFDYLNEQAKPADVLLLFEVMHGIQSSQLPQVEAFPRRFSYHEILRRVFNVDLPDPATKRRHKEYNEAHPGELTVDRPYPGWVRPGEEDSYNLLRRWQIQFRADFLVWDRDGPPIED